VLLITRDFTPLVIIAIAFGLPAAYWAMTEWLSDFAYRTTIGTGPILWASFICLAISFGTASFEAIKSALLDPAANLRNE
jgi:putative ABC transport system permease protein